MPALFGKTKKSKEPKKESEAKVVKDEVVQEEQVQESAAASSAFLGTGGVSAHKILKSFYVSEKSSLGNADNQYMFRVYPKANKTEVRKEVSKLFNVKVKSVKMLNMPEKRRDFGKHPGERSGFKKAIVVLEEGYSIGQAKP